MLKHTPDADPTKTQYPIALSESKWKDQARHIRGASEQATAFIRSRQPFVMAPTDPERDPLAGLNALAIIDRHRIPLLTLAASAGVESRFDATKLRGNLALNNDWGSRYMTQAHISPPGRGWQMTSPEGVVTDQLTVDQLSFRIAFNEKTGPYEGWDVIESLWQVGDYIQTEIFPVLEEDLASK